jgi:hypothetical protein
MTSLLFENFAEYSGTRDQRVLSLARSRADDRLAGRTVWCARTLGTSAPRAQALGALLPAVLQSRPIELASEEPLRRIGQRLRALLSRRGTEALDRSDAEDLASAMLQGERIVGDAVGSGDVVVLEDPLSIVLAPAVRERGAHAVLEIRPASARGRGRSGPAERILRRCDPAVDARVMIWNESGPAGVKRIAAVITSEDVIAAKEITARGSQPEDICWATMLAEVVELDRSETVGGMLHARPTVAVR